MQVAIASGLADGMDYNLSDSWPSELCDTSSTKLLYIQPDRGGIQLFSENDCDIRMLVAKQVARLATLARFSSTTQKLPVTFRLRLPPTWTFLRRPLSTNA